MFDETDNESTEPVSKSSLIYIILGSMVVGLVMAIALLLTNRVTPATTVIDTSAQFQPIVKVGELAPNFTATTLDGDTVRLSDYRGQVVFLNFWATWCVPCQREMPAFDSYMQQSDRDGVILAVNNGESQEPIQTWLDANSILNVPVLLDENYGISDLYVALNLPITYIIDRNGIVRSFKFGELTTDDLNSYLEALAST